MGQIDIAIARAGAFGRLLARRPDAIASAALHLCVVIAALFVFSRTTAPVPGGAPSIVPIDVVLLSSDAAHNTSGQSDNSLQQPAQTDAHSDGVASTRPPDVATPNAANNSVSTITGEASESAVSSAYSAPGAGSGTPAHAEAAVSLASALRNQFAQCWHPDGSLQQPAVTLEIFLNPDGSIPKPPELLTAFGGDPAVRAAADGAKRAIYLCAPFHLPSSDYETWRDFVLTFDPRANNTRAR